MPFHHQFNLQASYHFKKNLKGLEFKMLIAGKIHGNSDLTPKYIYNNVNLMNLILFLTTKFKILLQCNHP